MDNTTVHPLSRDLEHLVDLFVFKGRPLNLDPNRKVSVLINHGYAVGFSPDRLQPLWAAYRVAGSTRSVDYDRPHLYYEDTRLTSAWRIGKETFGKHNDIQYHVGHMVPNEVINVQFGRLAQMETFFMSNMSPQRGSLNTGVWLAMENAIRRIEDTPARDHVWAIAGPIFSDNPEFIDRPNGLRVPIPESYYYISIDPFRYPWDRQSNVDIACFIFPQDAQAGSQLTGFGATLDEIEQATSLSFFPGWAPAGARADAAVTSVETEEDTAAAPVAGTAESRETRHRLLRLMSPA